MARRSEVGLEIVEPAHAEERVAENQERPAIPHDGKRAGDRAGHVADVAPAHGTPYRFLNGTKSRGRSFAARVRLVLWLVCHGAASRPAGSVKQSPLRTEVGHESPAFGVRGCLWARARDRQSRPR